MALYHGTQTLANVRATRRGVRDDVHRGAVARRTLCEWVCMALRRRVRRRRSVAARTADVAMLYTGTESDVYGGGDVASAAAAALTRSR